MSKICIVIPCYNEEKRFDRDEFLNFCQENNFNFVLVNDGSSDNTLTFINAVAALFPEKIKVLDLAVNGGKAEAVRQGVIYANALGFDYIGFFDADFATPLSELLHFKNIISRGDYDIIMGSRIKRLGSSITRNSKRHYIGRVFATIASNLLGIAVYDTQCGAKIFKVAIIEPLFAQPFVSKWIFDVELLARYIKKFGEEYAEKKIYEFPLNSWQEKKGSKIKGSDMITVPMELYKIYINQRTRNNN